jgi:hypothetical protein
MNISNDIRNEGQTKEITMSKRHSTSTGFSWQF